MKSKGEYEAVVAAAFFIIRVVPRYAYTHRLECTREWVRGNCVWDISLESGLGGEAGGCINLRRKRWGRRRGSLYGLYTWMGMDSMGVDTDCILVVWGLLAEQVAVMDDRMGMGMEIKTVECILCADE